MIGEDKKRALRDFGDFPNAPAPALDPKAVNEATRGAVFKETPKAAAPATVPPDFATHPAQDQANGAVCHRLRPETLEAIYAYSDRHKIPLAETIERAMSALIDPESRAEYVAVCSYIRPQTFSGAKIMRVDTVVRARVDAETKDSATKALAEMGLSVSDYIRMALVRVARDKAIPFPVKVPSAKTAAAMEKTARGEDVHKAKDADDLFKQLGI